MANGHENLKNQSQRTKDEQRAIASKGGKASGQARRRKKMLKEGIAAMMQEQAPEGAVKSFRKAGFDVSTNYEAMVAACMIGAMNGNVRMLELVSDLMGERERDVIRREMLELDRERFEVEKKRTEAETKRVELMNKEMSNDDEEETDDGFIEALKGTASADWSEGDEEEQES